MDKLGTEERLEMRVAREEGKLFQTRIIEISIVTNYLNQIKIFFLGLKITEYYLTFTKLT